MKEIKVGTCGYWMDDWVGPVYPKGIKSTNALVYYEKQLGFDVVEVDSSYYTLMSTKVFENMSKKTSDKFEFIVKAYRGITHDPFDERLGGQKSSLQKVKEDTDKFLYSISPLVETGKLTAVLLQFPVFFLPSQQTKDYILLIKEWLSGVKLVIEFRNNKWCQYQTFEFLKTNNLAYCIVDEPKLPRLMPFVNIVTSDIAYFRLHGRNKNWFNTSTEERYNYLYSDDEIKEFIPEIDKMTSQARKTYILFNNCNAGAAVRNAITLKQMLGLTKDKPTLF